MVCRICPSLRGAVFEVVADNVPFSTAGEGEVTVRKVCLNCTWSESNTESQFEGAEAKIDLNIQANTESKSSKLIAQVSVVTGLNQEPSLPDTVTVEYDKGFPKGSKVTAAVAERGPY